MKGVTFRLKGDRDGVQDGSGETGQAKSDYNAFLAVCPSRQLLGRLSDRWVVLILCALGGDGPGAACEPVSMRDSELSRLIAGASQRMVTKTLRSLERYGLIARTVTPTVPVTVDYALTELGVSLHQTMRQLRAWAQDHMDAVQTSRDRYNTQH